MDISVTSYRIKGERRGGHNFTKPKPESFHIENIPVMNPLPIILNHRKHEGKLYRKAISGVEETFARIQGILTV